MRLDRHNTKLVALHSAGREVVLWEQTAPGMVDPGLARYDVHIESARVELGEVIGPCGLLEIEEWVERKREELDWLNPYHR